MDFCNFFEVFKNHARSIGAKTAFKVTGTGRTEAWTYDKFFEDIVKIALYLKKSGVSNADNIALFSENSPEWALSYFGIHLSSAAVTPFDAQFTERELNNLIKFAGIEIIFTTAELFKRVITKLSDDIKLKTIIIIDRDENSEADKILDTFMIGGRYKTAELIYFKKITGSVEEEFIKFKSNGFSGLPQRRYDDTMSLIFTSGTTGDPKGVMLTDKNFAANAEAIVKLNVLNSKDVVLLLLPLHHCFSFTATLLAPLCAGAEIVFQLSLKGPDILEAMNVNGVTKMAGVPQLYSIFDKNIMAKTQKIGIFGRIAFNILYKLSGFIYDKTGLIAGKLFFRKIKAAFGGKFQYFVSGGAKLDPDVSRRMILLGLEIIEGYGLTETAPVLSLNPYGAIKIGSCGKPFPEVEIKIDNPDKDNIGEIIARGPNIMKGYYKHEDATREVIKEGWFHTGDLGYLDKDGYLFITGRAKDVIVMASGKNVYPEEVEKHYLQCPYVSEMCVMGANSDSIDGKIEKLRAIVVPNYKLLREQNITNCSHQIKCAFEELALKVPTYMRINDFKIISEELPRTRLGKLKRNEIQKRGLFERESDDIVKKPIMTPEEIVMMSHPFAEKLVTRLKLLTGKKEMYPKDNLELDLGIDSLTRLELMVILDSEFGLKINVNEAADLICLRDVISKVIAEGSEKTGQTSDMLLEILKKEPGIPFEKKYSLRYGIIGTFFKYILSVILYVFLKITCRLEVEGVEKIDEKKGFLICPNHSSYIDPVLIFTIIPEYYRRRIFFIALEEMFGGGVWGWFRRLFRVITTGTEATTTTSLQYSSAALSKGYPICIFPEGQRNIDGSVLRPKKGFAVLACKHQIPIYPVYLKGTINLLSKPNPDFKRTNLKLTVCDPIYPPAKEAFNEADYDEIIKKWHLLMIQMEHKG